MNVTILCRYLNSEYGRMVLHALNARGMTGVNVLAAEAVTPRNLDALWRAHGWRLPLVAARHLLLPLKGAARRAVSKSGAAAAPTLQSETIAQGGRFIAVEEINGEASCRALRELATDLTILAGTPIIRAPVLEVPRIGTLNAHQGELPRFRGMSVIEWSIFEGAAPTITIHFVDPGVDTGDIVAEERIPLQPGDTLAIVRARAGGQQVVMLARVAEQALAGTLSRRPQRVQDGQQYFIMHPKLRTITEKRLQQRLHTPAHVDRSA
jgi:methionyl-tRNA formyltransferase